MPPELSAQANKLSMQLLHCFPIDELITVLDTFKNIVIEANDGNLPILLFIKNEIIKSIAIKPVGDVNYEELLNAE